MFQALAIYVLSTIVAVGVGVFVWNKFYTFDHKRHERQRVWAHFADQWRARGADRIADIYDELAFDDVVEFFANLYDLAEKVLANPAEFSAEMEGFFASELQARWNDPTQRTLLQAKLDEYKALSAVTAKAA